MLLINISHGINCSSLKCSCDLRNRFCALYSERAISKRNRFEEEGEDEVKTHQWMNQSEDLDGQDYPVKCRSFEC